MIATSAATTVTTRYPRAVQPPTKIAVEASPPGTDEAWWGGGTPASANSAPRNTEEGRALLQARLNKLGKFGLWLSLIFMATSLLLIAIAEVPGASATAAAQGVNALLSGLMVMLTRRGRRSARLLVVLDAGMVWIGTGAYIALGAALPLYARPELVQLLTVTDILGLRAFLVPSSARRTFLLGSLPLLVVTVMTYFLYRDHGLAADGPSPLMLAVIAGLLSAGTLTITTLTSSTIFGLRERVREAFQLGQYTLHEKIGEGGMGSVYKAQHAVLRRPTAIKLLPPGRAGAHNLARFEREVQLTSQLTHPNTVAIYDYGRSAEGILYYAMEYLDGLDLESVVQLSGPQDPARVVHVLHQVCGALDEAHSLGLIHRDVKPANILLCARGGRADVAKVVDFGLVKELNAAGDGAESGAYQIVGTPLYMSPESIGRPDSVSARSDLYALGAVGYFLLTGSPPFSGRSIVEVCAEHLHKAPTLPSERLGRALPTDLEQILLKCLAKSPEARPQSARELAHLLRSCHVPRWTAEQADRWWQERVNAISVLRKQRRDPRASASTLRMETVAIDLAGRAGNAQS